MNIFNLVITLTIVFGLGFFVVPTVLAETPSLTFVKLDSPDPVAAGANLTYTLNFTIADTSANNVSMTDEIPAYTSFVSASDPGTYDANTNLVNWNFGTLAPGNYVVTLTVKVEAPLANGTKIANQATLDADNIEPVLARAETTVSSAPILTLTKSVDKNEATVGESVLFTIMVKNTGVDTAYNVKLADSMPAGFLFESGTNSFTYALGNIEAGKQVATSYPVKIDQAVTAGVYTNNASITADNHTKLQASQSLTVRTPTVLGEEITVQEEITQEQTLPEPKVLGEESLPATGMPFFGTIFLSFLSALSLVYVGRKVF